MISFRLFGSAELRDEQGRSLDGVLRRPKRLALLAYLALTSRDGFQRKDKLVALFWPESDQARARQALRQALYVLRTELGDGVILNRGDEEVALNLDAVRTDVAGFEDALQEGREEDAVILYRGELLDGFHLSGAGEFERWLDDKRRSLRRQVLLSARALLETEDAIENSSGVVRWAQRLLDIVPSDEYSVRKLILHRALLGDRAGAVREYETFAKRLMADFAVEPSSYTVKLVEKIKAGRDVESEPRSGARDFRSESALRHARLNWAEHLAAEDDLDAVESTAELERQVEPQYTIQRENDASRQPKSAHVPPIDTGAITQLATKDKRIHVPRRWYMALGTGVMAGMFVLGVLNFPDSASIELLQPLPLTSFRGFENHPAISPDGHRVAFTWDGGPGGATDLYVMLADGGQPLRLTESDEAEAHPAWSPDGTRIAFLRATTSSSWEVRVIPSTGGPSRLIANATSHGLDWSPDSEHVAVMTDGGIHVISVASGESRRVTNPPANQYDRLPAFSPDGTRLAFQRVENNTDNGGWPCTIPLGGEKQQL